MKIDLWLIFLVVFIDLLGFGIVIPTLPFIAKHYGASPSIIGLLAGSYSLFQFIGSPILGRLSDKWGRKPILSFSLFGTAFGYLIIAFAQSLPILFISRIIDGITGGNISVAQAYIADTTKGRERTKAMGLIGAAFGLGFIFGPLIGGILSQFGFTIPYIFAGLLAFLNGIFIVKLLPESEKKSTQRKVTNLFSIDVFKEVFRPKIIFYLTILYILITFAAALMQGLLPLYTQQLFKWGPTDNGYFFAFIGLISVITQAVILRRIIDKVTERSIIQFSLFAITIGFLFFASAKVVLFIYLAGGFFALSFGLLNASLQSEVSRYSNPDEQGVVLGVIQGFNSLARAFGPAVGGFLYGNFFIQAPFYAASILLFIAGIYSTIMFKRNKVS